MRSDQMTKEDVLAVLDRDSEQAWQYRDLQDGDIDESERLSEESKQARATVEALWEERERLQATLNNTLAERDAAEHVAQSSRISAIDAESRATRAEAALKEAMAWRPIESAPRDGTLVMFYVPDSKPVIARADDYTYSGAYWLHPATHWMPLPAPPALEDRPNG
jgi:hypothetical protein